MNLVVHTGTRNGTNIPLLRTFEFKASPRYDPDAAKKLAVDLRDIHNPLLQDTKVKSEYEKLFKTRLLALGVQVDYEPFSLLVGKNDGRGITYTPDFVTNLEINGKQVIIEPHCMLYHPLGAIKAEVTKLKMFKQAYKNRFYLVIASDMSLEVLKFRVETDLNRVIDEYWETPQNRPLERATIKEKLEGLIRRAKRE